MHHRSFRARNPVGIAAVLNAAATVLAGVVYFYPTYSSRLLLIGFPWGITAPLFMLLLAIALRRRSTLAA